MMRQVARSSRVVSSFPLDEVWSPDGPLPLRRGDDLDRSAVETMLRKDPVQFIVAEVGSPLEWIPLDDSRKFWRRDAAERLVGPKETGRLDDFTESYFYRAQAWTDDGGECVLVLLEKNH
jgi:hypothetical protein